MSEYNVSKLISIMKDGFADTQNNTGRILLETVAKHPQVNVDVDDKMISNLVSRKKDVHTAIKSGAGKREVMKFARGEVIKNVMDKINPLLMDDVCTQILDEMSSDRTVSDGFCNKMQQLYADENFVDFITDSILYALSKTNLPAESKPQIDDFLLLEEADYKCPIEGKKLWKKVKGKYEYSYRVVKIFPEGLSDEKATQFNVVYPKPRDLDLDENKIALCEDCAEKYLADPTLEEYERLLDCKGRLKRRYDREKIAADYGVEDQIVDVIKAISDIDVETQLQPFTDALELKEKILPENFELELSIKDDVVRYYPFIEKQFSLLDGAQGATFTLIRSEVATCYNRYVLEGGDQSEIYYALVDWLLKAKGLGEKHRTAATVMISFFVQNCAVFEKYNSAGAKQDGGVDDETSQ